MYLGLKRPNQKLNTSVKQFSDSLKAVEHAEKDKRNAFQERDELAACLEEAEQMAENTEQSLAKMTNEMHDVKVEFLLYFT